mmetsp:Transcript_12946/g.14419  ORF Transcript_12946/g.14419 Transcript_12946/m.14419 type:complete len:384 (+) Transcript_12946:113-1264(+)
MNGEKEPRKVIKIGFDYSTLNTNWKTEDIYEDEDDDEFPEELLLMGIENFLVRDGLSGKGVKIGIIDTGINNKEVLLLKENQNKLRTSVDTSHGTAVASIVHRMVPNAELHDYCVFNSSGSFDTPTSIADSIIKAYDDGCRVILLTMGLPTVDLKVIRALTYVSDKKDAIIITAPGNPGNNDDVLTNEWSFPAVCFDDVLNVGVLDETLRGVKFNTDKKNPNVTYVGFGNRISPFSKSTLFSGTSFAAPQVCGLIAALLSDNSSYKPSQDRSLLEAMHIILSDKFAIDIGIPGYEGEGTVKFLTYLDQNEFVTMMKEFSGTVFENMQRSRKVTMSPHTSFRTSTTGPPPRRFRKTALPTPPPRRQPVTQTSRKEDKDDGHTWV